MEPHKIATSYDHLASHWASDQFNRKNGIAQHERAIAFVTERGHALDVGCGCSGRIIDLLAARGFDVEGLDISDRMIALAKERHPGIQFHRADICRWKASRRYDFISAWDSIWHVPMKYQEPVLRKLLRALNPGGACVFTAGGLDAPGEKTDSTMGQELYYSVLGIPKTLRTLEEEGSICRHLEYDQYPELHLYIIAQKA